MGQRVDGKVIVDLDDLKNAAPYVDQAYSWGGKYGGAYSAREVLRFVAQEPLPEISFNHAPEVMHEPTYFELTRKQVYEPHGSYVTIWDYWMHGDVLVRKKEVGYFRKHGYE